MTSLHVVTILFIPIAELSLSLKYISAGSVSASSAAFKLGSQLQGSASGAHNVPVIAIVVVNRILVIAHIDICSPEVSVTISCVTELIVESGAA